MSEAAEIEAIMRGAGRIALRYFRTVRPRWKASQSYVTDADLDVQAYLREQLAARFPEDGIIAEEKDLREHPRTGSRHWIVDPIDGTAAFVAGLPVWGIGLALVEEADPVAGFFLMPATGDFFHTGAGGAVYRCGEPARMKEPASLHRESVLLSISRLHRSFRLAADYPGKVRNLGSTIAHICYVATGSADAALIGRVHIWDIAPGLAMLKKRGGVLHYVGAGPVSVKELLDGSAARGFMLCGHPAMVRRFARVCLPLADSHRS